MPSIERHAVAESAVVRVGVRKVIFTTGHYGVQLTAGPFVFSFPGELQFTM